MHAARPMLPEPTIHLAAVGTAAASSGAPNRAACLSHRGLCVLSSTAGGKLLSSRAASLNCQNAEDSTTKHTFAARARPKHASSDPALDQADRTPCLPHNAGPKLGAPRHRPSSFAWVCVFVCVAEQKWGSGLRRQPTPSRARLQAERGGEGRGPDGPRIRWWRVSERCALQPVRWRCVPCCAADCRPRATQRATSGRPEWGAQPAALHRDPPSAPQLWSLRALLKRGSTSPGNRKTKPDEPLADPRANHAGRECVCPCFRARTPHWVCVCVRDRWALSGRPATQSRRSRPPPSRNTHAALRCGTSVLKGVAPRPIIACVGPAVAAWAPV